MIGIAAVVGAAALFGADMWISKASEPRVVEVAAPARKEKAVEFATIVVAKEMLKFGDDPVREKLAEIPWQKDKLPEGAFKTIEEVAKSDRLVMAAIMPNEPVLLSKLSGEGGKATLANKVSPGMRAVSVKVDEVSGVGGFIQPGDYVDLLVTSEDGNGEGEGETKQGVQARAAIVLANIRVLSVGQKLDDADTASEVSKSVTLEVSVDGAQKVAQARAMGQMTLTLRGVGAEVTAALPANTDAATVQAIAETPIAVDGPKTRTVIVTRGLEAQTYSVISQD